MLILPRFACWHPTQTVRETLNAQEYESLHTALPCERPVRTVRPLHALTHRPTGQLRAIGDLLLLKRRRPSPSVVSEARTGPTDPCARGSSARRIRERTAEIAPCSPGPRVTSASALVRHHSHILPPGSSSLPVSLQTGRRF